VELERWARVAKFPLYEVSTWGAVRRGRDLVASWVNKRGYATVSLEHIDPTRWPRAVNVAPLVLEAFVGPRPPRHQANHGDGDKTNNRLDNLEWVTPKVNMAHARAAGLVTPRARAAQCRRGHAKTPGHHCLRCRAIARWSKRERDGGFGSLLELLAS
jgi:HNH endonuclease